MPRGSKKDDVSVSKDVLPELPEEFVETPLGDKRGARKQFRSRSTRVHVREYEDSFAIHVDRENPEVNPVGHLLRDSPETIAAAAATLLVATEEIRKRDSNASRRFCPHFVKLSPLGIVAVFTLLNGTLRFLKELLLG